MNFRMMHLTLIPGHPFLPMERFDASFEYELKTYFPKHFSSRITDPLSEDFLVHRSILHPVYKSIWYFDNSDKRRDFFNRFAQEVADRYGSPFLLFASVYEGGGYATDLGAFVDTGGYFFNEPGTVRTAAHELGHVLGIEHHGENANPKDPCLMDSGRSDSFFRPDLKRFCQPCMAHLEQRL